MPLPRGSTSKHPVISLSSASASSSRPSGILTARHRPPGRRGHSCGHGPRRRAVHGHCEARGLRGHDRGPSHPGDAIRGRIRAAGIAGSVTRSGIFGPGSAIGVTELLRPARPCAGAGISRYLPSRRARGARPATSISDRTCQPLSAATRPPSPRRTRGGSSSPLRTWQRPRLVSGWFSIWWKTLAGTVAMSQPSDAATTMCSGCRIGRPAPSNRGRGHAARRRSLPAPWPNQPRCRRACP